MNLHKNAKTCPKSRALMVSRVRHEGRAVAQVAQEFGVSRQTVYKWLNRHSEHGATALADGSSTPQRLPHRLGDDWVALIVTWRRQFRMTARAIAQQFQLPRSTVSGVLRREGLSRLKDLDPVEPVRRYEHAAPGEMLHIDIKKLGRFRHAGHRLTGARNHDSRGAGWEYVHVCIDDYSRVAYAEVLPNERKESASAFLRRAVRWFGQYGITVKRVLTDNGACYLSHLWRDTCQALGISMKKTRRYRPQTNGKAERFIQTLIREWAYVRVYATSDERKGVLPMYLAHYNYHREHSSLNYQPPINRIPSVNNVVGNHN